MAGEAQLVVFAGEGTTAWTMHAALYQILANPVVCKELKAELATLNPTSDGVAALVEVEALPYLSAVIQETIRCHPGVMSRQIRVSPKSQFSTQTSMSPMDVHMNPDCFKDPYVFRPERWIENPKLSKDFLGFGRGSRNCLDRMALARRELSLTLATLFLKYDLYRGQDGPTMELYDTVRARDIDAVREFIAPFPAPGSRGLQVKFRS
ncbi:hypothetical protein N7465_010816 [Penicillium sp. CMV-2018d]|nr:hypothetical protein N7465_010816 [Penicillium sp. CMV-2018d]